MQNALPSGLYAHPFSKAYWRDAVREFRTTKMLVFAALMVALRVVCKPLTIPVGPMLNIPIAAMLVNALGAMAFGPVVAIPAAAISDTLGYLLYPNGVYFFPYIFVEIAGSLIFSLFLYRTRVTVWRVLMARFCIDFFVNIALQTPITILYYSMVLGKAYPGLVLLHVVKEVVMFPIETVVIAVFFRLAVPPLHNQGFVKSDIGNLKFTVKTVVTLVLLTAVGAAGVFGYSVHTYNTTSLSASYTEWERYAHNLDMREIAVAQDDSLTAETAVAVVESAFPVFGDPKITYTVAVYRADPAAIALRAEANGTTPADEMRAILALSRSKAAKLARDLSVPDAANGLIPALQDAIPDPDHPLTRLYTLTVVTGDGTEVRSVTRTQSGN